MNTPRPSIEPLESRIAPAVFTVTTTVDTSDPAHDTGSLRDALALADVNPATHDTIIFHLPTNQGTNGVFTITLDGTQLSTKGNVTITGPGAGELILNGANTSRVLYINDNNPTTDSPVTISGLSIINGKAGTGAGIRSTESLTLNSVTVTGNTATGAGGGVLVSGGADNGRATINNSIISGNTAANQGGLSLVELGSISINKTVVTGNSATAASSLGGGVYALASPGGRIAINGCQISKNYAGVGGGLWVGGYQSETPKITISSSIITNNQSNSTTPGDGDGGMFVGMGNALSSNTVISDNSAFESGGGITSAGSNLLAISNSIISNNSAGDVGGGFDFHDFKSLKITGTAILSNRDTSTTHGAGGGYAELETNGAGITVSGCVVSGNTADHGAGLFITSYATAPSAKVTVASTRITGNTATGTAAGGGGLYIRYGHAIVANSSIGDNRALYYGGGMEANGFASLTISRDTISDNKATTQHFPLNNGGGGLFIKGPGTVTMPQALITGSKFIGNESAVYGGGIFATGGLALTISASTFSDNAAGYGGGVATLGGSADDVNLTVNGSTFLDNFTTGDGGGLFANGTGAVALTASKVTGNYSVFGGGISINAQAPTVPITLSNLAVTQNVARYGGGVFIDSSRDFKIAGGAVIGNSANKGGGIDLVNCTGSVTGVTISGNSAFTDGGGILIIQPGNGVVTLQAAKVFANIAPTDSNVSGPFTPFP